MTTAAPSAGGEAALRLRGVTRSAGAVVAAGALLSALGAAVAGSAAATGAALGALVVVVFFTFGAVSVNAVARVAPRASLLVALTTYTLQVALLAVLLLSLARSSLVPDTVAPRWLGASVMVGALLWTAVLAVTTLRAQADVPGAAGGVRREGPVRGS